mmetsp:Transcript_26599/g.76673  ORF Transcript_26599/g.76673 Transcript_26599/m.76673 type:complete len:200 (+) Transcript_26599:1138-1737(+)
MPDGLQQKGVNILRRGRPQLLGLWLARLVEEDAEGDRRADREAADLELVEEDVPAEALVELRALDEAVALVRLVGNDDPREPAVCHAWDLHGRLRLRPRLAGAANLGRGRLAAVLAARGSPELIGAGEPGRLSVLLPFFLGDIVRRREVVVRHNVDQSSAQDHQHLLHPRDRRQLDQARGQELRHGKLHVTGRSCTNKG